MLGGVYSDPLHGGALRTIRAISPGVFRVFAAYEADEPRPAAAPATWWATLTMRPPNKVEADFSGKFSDSAGTIHAPLAGTYADGIISWSDGNQWTRLPQVFSRQPPPLAPRRS